MDYGNAKCSTETNEPKLRGLYLRIEKANAVLSELNSGIDSRLTSLVGAIPSGKEERVKPIINCALDEFHELVNQLENNLNWLSVNEKRLREFV